ncbi:hypothetical protein PIB30_091467 [Stylosanthes scabra]|uniref:Uncharacterized protein n=1 Tax=Stylosanthes scabra TaxID=79078 RepID=A0ABU6SVE2_9FABA|nr:hypothetical protein [Stylosanthes scabra]
MPRFEFSQLCALHPLSTRHHLHPQIRSSTPSFLLLLCLLSSTSPVIGNLSPASLQPLSSSPICSLLVFCASRRCCLCSLSPPVSSLCLSVLLCSVSAANLPLAAAAGLSACAISVAATALSSRRSDLSSDLLSSSLPCLSRDLVFLIKLIMNY